MGEAKQARREGRRRRRVINDFERDSCRNPLLPPLSGNCAAAPLVPALAAEKSFFFSSGSFGR